MKSPATPCASFLLVSAFVMPFFAGMEVVATKSLTIQPTGPRTEEGGSKYFNIEGKSNEEYASFAVLLFEIPQEIQGVTSRA